MRSGLEPCVSDVLLFWLFKYANWDLHSILLKRQDTTFAFHRHRQSLQMAVSSRVFWRQIIKSMVMDRKDIFMYMINFISGPEFIEKTILSKPWTDLESVLGAGPSTFPPCRGCPDPASTAPAPAGGTTGNKYISSQH